jgi:hypothetical protein
MKGDRATDRFRLSLVKCAALCAAFFLAGCDAGTRTEAPDFADGRTRIVNDDSELASRLRLTQQPVPLQSVFENPAASAREPELELVAEIDPPTIGGRTLQANSVVRKGELAIIGYNVQGPDHLGAIEIIEVDDDSPPEILSLALFNDTDVNAVDVEEGRVYAAEATRASAAPGTAVLEILKLEEGELVLEGGVQLPLPSFAGTGVHVTDKLIFTSSGDRGGLSVFDSETRAPLAHHELNDARWVASDRTRVVVAQGTPGRISVLSSSGAALSASFAFRGANIPEAKSTVDLAGGKAFVAGGSEGAHFLSLVTGHRLGGVPVPSVPGVAPEDAVTNAVSVDDDLLFLSNGGAGVLLVQFERELEDTDSESIPEIQRTRRLLLDALESVNHVSYRDDLLVVAAGLGGVKIIKVD